jgi:hypothetical protein
VSESTPFDDNWVDPKASGKAPESAVETTTVAPEGKDTPEVGTHVNVTLKAGKGYEAPWITFQGATVYHVLSQFKGWTVAATIEKYPVTSDALATLIREVNGAGLMFQEDYGNRGGSPAPRTYGKPANANDTPAPAADSNDVPFDSPDPEPMMACKHGTRTLVEWEGKKVHVCKVGKGNPDYCAPIVV